MEIVRVELGEEAQGHCETPMEIYHPTGLVPAETDMNSFQVFVEVRSQRSKRFTSTVVSDGVSDPTPEPIHSGYLLHP